MGCGVLHVGRPLAHGDRVRRPFEQAGVEVPELAAAAVRVGRVPRTPEAGSEPLVPIEDQRVGLGRLGGPPAVAAGVDRAETDGRVGMHREQPAELAATRQADGELEGELVLALCARLVDDAVAPDVVGHRIALVDGHGAGLLAVHVLARLRRPHRHGPVPAIAGGDQESVDVVPRQQLGGVAVHLAVVVLVIAIDRALDLLAGALADVGDGDETNPLVAEQLPQVAHAAVADADAAETDGVADGVVADHHRPERRLSGNRAA